jgi:DNA-binding NarL/FixJ family response regulator
VTHTPIKVLLVEDNDIFRESLVLLLDAFAPDVDVVGAVADGRRAVEECAGKNPDVVLMDYRLPELDGVETTAAIRDVRPEAAVVVLSAEAGYGEIEALKAAGAVSFLTKDCELEQIVGAVRDAARTGASLG